MKTKDRTIITTPSNEPLSTSEQSLTRRAADLGYAPRSFDFFLALGFFRFDGESTLPPQAANAHRWAAVMEEKELLT
jgi:hypothetical protein